MLEKIICMTLFGFLVKGEVLQIKNNGQNELLVSVTALEGFRVSPGNTVPITVSDDFTGTITAIPSDLGEMNGPRTTVELTLSPMGDAYDISLLNGFNIKAKITPLQGRRCKPAACSVDINSLCSSSNQALDNTGKLAGCYPSLFLFKSACPKAVVTTADVRNVFTCTADSYFITLG